MHHTARLPSQQRATPLGAVLSSLGTAVRDTLAFVFVRDAHAFFTPPPGFRHPVSRRALRFMRGGE